MTRRADLTDAEWARLAPLLPRGKKAGRPPKWTKRQLIDGVRWRVRVGAPWRDVAEQYGPWQTVYGLFRRWQRTGIWALILKMLQAVADAAGAIVSHRCHQPVATPRVRAGTARPHPTFKTWPSVLRLKSVA
ncbi:transposase [Nocardia gipuzkoensis]|uniref:transposase n=1 Tax=Nocardia gipuzkoensis TaxID=2749991 RepID=UPI00237DA721|nr:transposase [Nocardia gipuzkoensis]MDE1675309.1 transposase [Nocardia gipuzkoensis]